MPACVCFGFSLLPHTHIHPMFRRSHHASIHTYTLALQPKCEFGSFAVPIFPFCPPVARKCTPYIFQHIHSNNNSQRQLHDDGKPATGDRRPTNITARTKETDKKSRIIHIKRCSVCDRFCRCFKNDEEHSTYNNSNNNAATRGVCMHVCALAVVIVCGQFLPFGG